MNGSNSMTPAPQCPRCGYDQSGLVAAWKDAWPLSGTCSECGLTFPWSDVLGARFLGPRWSYEHGLHPSLGRWFATLARSLLPRRMWTELTLATAVRRARLVQFAVVLPIVAHILYAALVISRLAADPWVKLSRIDWLLAAVFPYSREVEIAKVEVGGGSIAALLCIFPVTLLIPLPMFVLRQTLTKCRVRPVHLLRGLCYSIPSATLAAILFVMVFTLSQYLIRNGSSGIAVDELGGLIPMFLVWAAWLGVWWWTFVARYLRLPHAPFVALSMLIIAVLASPFVVWGVAGVLLLCGVRF